MKIRFLIACMLMVLHIFPCVGQSSVQDTSVYNDKNFYNMSLEQLMGIEVNVASIHGLSQRESPGIVTLFTEEEIKSSGARDLMDLLKMVPGFDFGVDVEGVVGLAVRGNWAHEGKALLLIDGLEMNENLFSTLQFGNHYPVNDIKRIEIIRGPGSAIYGGNAEYAVINIITKSPNDFNGSEIKAGYGIMHDVEGRKSISVSSGKQFGRFGYTFNYFGSEAIRSDHQYSDLYGGSFDMADNSKLSLHYINVGLNFNKLQFRGIMDKYTVASRDNYDVITSRSYPVKFDSYIGELKQEIQLSKNLTITPKVNFKLQLPWNYSGDVFEGEVIPFNISSSRYTGGISGSYDPALQINFTGGAEYFYDIARQLGNDVFVSNNSASLSYNNAACFGQGSWNNKIANLTLGARYNWNNRYPSSFVPRVSVIKVLEKTHFKLLYSQAYRSPNTQNIDLNPNIQPEKTSVVEFETGLKILKSIYITGNIFDITTKNPIVFYYDNLSDADMYQNSTETGTQGAELDLQWKWTHGYLEAGYGYYTAVNKNKLSDYKVPDKPHSLLGIPNQKITLSSLLKLYKNYSINVMAAFSGVKYGATSINANGEPVIGQYDPALSINISFKAEDLFIKGLNGSVGVYNLLNDDEYYVQPYNGGHAGLPGPSREIIFSLSYKMFYK